MDKINRIDIKTKERKQGKRGVDADAFEAALLARVQPDQALAAARNRILGLQDGAGFWVFDLEADATIPSEYVLIMYCLGRTLSPELKQTLRSYLLSKQLPDGGWPLFDVDGQANISCSVKAYFALKMLGETGDEPHMVRARTCIRSMGGAEKSNIFTRILLAQMGQISWDLPPAMPIEMMLLPKWFFFNLNRMSYWSRTVIVPLLIIYAHKPVFMPHPNQCIHELFVTPAEDLKGLDGFRGHWRKDAFILLDKVLKKTIRFIPDFIHKFAVKNAEKWTVNHMQGAGGIGAIFPAMTNAVLALKLLGYSEDHPDYMRGVQALDDLLIDRFETSPKTPEGPVISGSGVSAVPETQISTRTASYGDTSFFQPCVSPIWDTCLSLTSLLEGRAEPGHTSIKRGVDWLFEKQIHCTGDWAQNAPGLGSGGWAFQFENNQFPDLDDTSSVLMAMMRAEVHNRSEYGAVARENMAKAVRWVLGMQNSDGGWGAFDIDNNSEYLNDIPFADHGALLDPSTTDVTARCVEMLGMLGYQADHPVISRAIDFMKSDQEPTGSWFGRWGVNYIYGTWSALSGLAMVNEDMQAPYVRRAVDWLKSKQNPDGGWGETCKSYNDKRLAGCGDSTASQTAWALLGLMAADEYRAPETARGIRYLLDNQNKDGSWTELHYTGTGFPRVFYLRYHGYSQFFPTWALGVYDRLHSGEETRQQQVKMNDPEILLGK